jgi:hypothetical protein
LASYYVSATAPGGGSGSLGDPFTLVEAIASQSSAAMTDTYTLSPGTYNIAESFTLSKGLWSGDDPNNRPIIKRITTGGTNHVVVNAEVRVNHIIFDANNLATQNVTLGNSKVYRCLFFGTNGGSAAILGEAFECEFGLASASTASVSVTDNSVLTRCLIRNHTTAGIRVLGTSTISGCVIIGGQEAIRYDGGSIYAIDCVFFNCTSLFSSVGGSISRSIGFRTGVDAGIALTGRGYGLLSSEGGLRIGSKVHIGGYSTIVGSNTFGDTPATLTENPFIDALNLDFRLTEDAKNSPITNEIRHIAIGIEGVPNITVDGLDALLSGSAGPVGFTGICGVSRRIGT